jgi:hypothetical protein
VAGRSALVIVLLFKLNANGTFFMSNIFAECELPYSVNPFCAAMTIFVNGSASVRTSDPGASVGRVRSRTI